MKTFLLSPFVTLLSILTLATSAKADVQVASVFGDGMVLQRELPVPVWGTASPKEKVSVTFSGQEVSTSANEDGNWMVKLDPLKTSKEGRELVVKGDNITTFADVLVGEVWLCSGQSNMAGRFTASKGRAIDPKVFETMDLRCFRFNTVRQWMALDEKTQSQLSVVAFYFGIELYKELDVPIGLIQRYNSGTPIQAWMPEDAAEEIRKKLGIPEGWNDVQDQRNPGVQFNEKIAPIIPMAFRGTIWYQGERNAKALTGWEYRHLLPFHIKTWRELWAKSSNSELRKFPFYYVQVPTQGAPDDGGEWPWLRDGMRRAMSETENTGMAVFYDHGPSLHPSNKEPAGKRLALWALAKDYGHKDLVHCGPLLKEARYSDGKATLTFDHIGGGLKSKSGDKDLKFFELAGKDGKYHPAKARIEGDTVLLESDAVPSPTDARYLFRKPAPNPEVSLTNAEGLPASSFITDDRLPPRGENPSQPSQSKKPAAPSLRRVDGLPYLAKGLNPTKQSYQTQKSLADLEAPYVSLNPEDLEDGINVGKLDQPGAEDAVKALVTNDKKGKFGDLDSVLIWKDGKLLFEYYNRHGRVNGPHYAMSVTKTLTSLTLARAMHLGVLGMDDLDKPVIDFMPDIDRSKIKPGVETITLRDALYMKSGLRFESKDFERKLGPEFKGQKYFQHLFENTAPITPDSKQYKYTGTDPSMVMMVVDIKTPGKVQDFIAKEVTGKVGAIYCWEDQPNGLPKCGAGSNFTSRSLLKIGTAVIQGGIYNGEQLFHPEYIKEVLNTQKGDGYFYFFHNRNKISPDKTKIDFISGIGAGGQYMAVFPDLNLVAVATAHNKGQINLPLQAILDHLIPLFAADK